MAAEAFISQQRHDKLKPNILIFSGIYILCCPKWFEKCVSVCTVLHMLATLLIQQFQFFTQNIINSHEL